MRESTRRCLSVLMVVAVVGASTVAVVNLDQGPEPVQEYGPVGEADAVVCGGACVAGVALVAAGAGVAAGAYFSGSEVNKTALDQADTQETKTQIHTTAASGAESADQFTGIMNNWMEDGATIGRLEGQNQYVRALENGSSPPPKSEVMADAIEETNNWFAERQVRIIRGFEKQAITFRGLQSQAFAEGYDADQDWTIQPGGYDGAGPKNATATLANGSSVSFQTMQWQDSSINNPTVNPFPADPTGVPTPANRSLYKLPPNEDFSQIEFLDAADWYRAWNKTENARTAAVAEVQNFVDATYDKYEQGQIDTSDLITPTLSARNYDSEGDTGTFTLSALTRMGYSLPTDFSNTKTMELMADGEQYTGLLLSDGLPSGGEFEIGTQYNVSNIEGKQLIQTSDQLLEIEENVTIQSVQRADGSTKGSGSVKFDNPDFESADSMDAYAAQMENLSQQLAEINARQDRLRNGTSGTGIGLPGFGFGLSAGQKILALIALAGGAAIVLSRS
jgi:hypothetical protein